MDKNYEDILAALESHLKRNKDFIAQLKKLKPQSFTMRIFNHLSKSSSKQHEESSNHDTTQSDQTKKVDVNSLIQDIKDLIKTLEDKTKLVVENLPPTESAVSEKGEEKSSVTHFQVYERDRHTEHLITALRNILPNRCLTDMIEKVSDIDNNKPLIILCQSGSRLVPDINYSLELFEDLNSVTRLAIVVIHNKERHALPTTSSQSKLSEDVRFKNMWIIDAAFTNALKFYDCKMNNEAMAKIVSFLKSD